MPAGALVDDGGRCSFGKIVVARGAPAVDQANAAGVAVDDLIAAQVDWMVTGQVAVDALVELAVGAAAAVQSDKAAVVLGELLLDNIRFDSDAKMVGLAGQISGDVVILVVSNLTLRLVWLAKRLVSW